MSNDPSYAAAPDGSRILIELENVHKTYLLGVEGVAALRGVSLQIAAGEFVVLLGKSGSGKTSLLNIIGTVDQPTKGSLNIGGSRITNATPDSRLAMIRLRQLGFVFQTFNLISSMNALDNVKLPMILDGRLDTRAINQRALELLSRVGMANRLSHTPSQLSGGEQQRVTIARALANQPELLLADEPTGDLDSATSDKIIKLLVELNQQHHLTLVMVTHDVSLRSFAHRVVHMLDGKIQNIEIISEETRREAIQALDERLDDIRSLEQQQQELSPSNSIRHPVLEDRNPITHYNCVRRITPDSIPRLNSFSDMLAD